MLIDHERASKIKSALDQPVKGTNAGLRRRILETLGDDEE
jgi:hypothetical protein